ncbi:MAG: DUF624 domain-containing protein [Clostridia bacterium]|nr:DUF624 domain-containing protein [Clostridia bacterium]
MKLFNFKKDRPEILEEEDTTPNIRYYFKLLWRKFTKLLSINLLAILQIVPLIAIYFVKTSQDKPTITSTLFPVIQGIADIPIPVEEIDVGPLNQLMLSLSSIQYRIPHETWGMFFIIIGLFVLFVALFGVLNVGFTYLMREMINGNPVFIFSDMKYAIKRNFKQGFLFGLIDALLIIVLVVDFTYLNSLPSGFFGDFMYVGIIAIGLIYFIMRFYMYMMLITFDMKIRKIFKNALIFVMLGIKRNIMAILWTVFLLVINFCVLIIYTPLGIILPILYMPAIPMFTTAYAEYPVIKKYMIDPVPQENEDE